VRDKPEKFAYLPLAQGPVYAGTIAVRVAGNPSGVASAVRRAMHDIEPNLPIRWTTTLADEVSDSLVSERAIAELSGFFAAVALLLAAIGLYGTISFAAARRTSEIGIRMALGAEGAAVLGMVLKDALAVAGIGIAIGLPLSLGAGIVMKSLLYGLGSFDVLSAAAAVIALSLVAAVAGYIPARRAAAVDPMVALRYE
jgi:ABC-type antimicrobial peptide transport system permease subunit